MASQHSKKCGAFCSIQSPWIVLVYQNQTRAPQQTSIMAGVTLNIFITMLFFIMTDFHILLFLNRFGFVTIKRPESPGFLYYFNGFLLFILSSIGGRPSL